MHYGLHLETDGNVFSVVFYGFQHFPTKVKNGYALGLSVCARSRKYFSDVLKFMYAIYV